MAETEKQETRRSRGRRSWTNEQSVFWYRVGQLILGLVFRFWVRHFRVVGAASVPASGGMFLIANHTSGLDPFLLGLPVKQRMLRGPGKIELFKNPVVGWLMRKLGIFPLHREGVDTAAVRTMLELYRAGSLIIVYPEGGRSKTAEMKPFDPGFARLAIKLRAPLLPAGMAGAANVLPIGHYLPRFNTAAAVVYGQPFELSQYYGRPLTDELAEEAAAYMRCKVGELVDEARKLAVEAPRHH